MDRTKLISGIYQLSVHRNIKMDFTHFMNDYHSQKDIYQFNRKVVERFKINHCDVD